MGVVVEAVLLAGDGPQPVAEVEGIIQRRSCASENLSDHTQEVTLTPFSVMPNRDYRAFPRGSMGKSRIQTDIYSGPFVPAPVPIFTLALLFGPFDSTLGPRSEAQKQKDIDLSSIAAQSSDPSGAYTNVLGRRAH